MSSIEKLMSEVEKLDDRVLWAAARLILAEQAKRRKIPLHVLEGAAMLLHLDTESFPTDPAESEESDD